MHALPLQLGPGSDLHQSLSALARERQANGFVLSVVGNLSQAAFQCPGQSGPTMVRGDLEIITLQGTVGPEGVHLHLSLSDGTCQVYGGHLEPGTLVQKGAEILVGWLVPAAAPTPLATPQPQPEAIHAGLHPQTRPTEVPPVQLQPAVQLVVRSGCPWCGRAEQLLRTLGIAHTVLPSSGEAAVPQLLVGGETFVGYTALVQLFESGALDHLVGG
jgi:predicted DNA-binding protein with PD1-like motif/glutaredoxin